VVRFTPGFLDDKSEVPGGPNLDVGTRGTLLRRSELRNRVLVSWDAGTGESWVSGDAVEAE
jgi:hypothetical protein